MSVTESYAPTRVLTPSVGATTKKALYWVVALAFVLVIAVITMLLSGTNTTADRLSPVSPAPSGSEAVVEVLRQQGVDVQPSTSLTATEDAVTTAADDTTVLVYDNQMLLEPAQWEQIAALEASVIVVNPSFMALSALNPGVAAAGPVNGTVDADCVVSSADAQVTLDDDFGYRVISDETAQPCLGSGDDVYSLISSEVDGSVRTVLGASWALTNEGIVQQDNAAFALRVLGQSSTLVWYLPSLSDVAGDAPPSLAELSPDWVIPTALLLALTAIAAAVWRGRRFGPLVIENLPVTVRASETMEGRARLYAANSARLRALDALRVGSVGRLATLVALPRTASVEEVAAAVASALDESVGSIREILLDAVPANDAELVRLSDRLLQLEAQVARAVVPQ
ncbi:MAG TPA: DUF4350 domain-containing protein [Glaciihabitans sp.]|nr:DUF4350 domain-containing protein [Glaciihabitans sp.]